MGSVLTSRVGIADSEIINRAQATDHDGLELLYTVYAEGLTKFCRTRLNGREADAEDACHETLLRASRALPRFREGAPLWPWLATIAANVCKDMVRNDGRFRELVAEPADPQSVTEDEVDRRDRAAILVAAMGAVPAHYRKALYLREFESWSWEDIAKAEGRSVASVRSSLMRGRRFLRQSIRHEAERVNQWPLPTIAPRRWTSPWASFKERFQPWSSAAERMMALFPVPVSVGGLLGGMSAGSVALANASVAVVMAVGSLQGPASAPAAPASPAGHAGPAISASATVNIDGPITASMKAKIGARGGDWWEKQEPLATVPVGDGKVSVFERPASWGGQDTEGNTQYAGPGVAATVTPPSETGLAPTQWWGETPAAHCGPYARSTPHLGAECSVLDLTA
jgi:RNA polymerase sigma-70 factor (ECF subfamily)